MLTNPSTTVPLTDVLDALPDAATWMQVIRDEQDQIIEFRTEYVNGRAQELGKAAHSVVRKTFRSNNAADEKPETHHDFRAMCSVLTTREPYEFSQFNASLNQWFQVRWSKAGDGILSVSRTTPAPKNPEPHTLDLSAADLHAIIDNAQTGIFVFSPVYDETGRHVDFRFKTINRMVAELVQQTPDILTGSVASRWFTSYRETGLFDRYKHTFNTGEEQQFDINYNVDGFDVWFDVKSMRFGNDVLVTFSDTTTLRRAKQVVEQQADLLNSVLNSSVNGIIAFEAIRNLEGIIQDFRFLSINETGCRLVGKPAQVLIGSTLLTNFPGNVDTGLFDLYVHTTETNEPVHTELYYSLDGLDTWFDISAQKLGDGFVVTFSDISLIKRAASSIEQSAIDLRTIIDSAQVAIYLMQPVRNEAGRIVDFRFQTANQMVANYVGQESVALTGELVSHWFPSYLTNGLYDRYIVTHETGRTQHFNFNYLSALINAWISVTVTKVDNDVLVTFSDFTPLKQLQQQLENSVTELQRSNQNLEQFAYVASHDLQEPLRKIQSFGDILESQYAPLLGETGSDIVRRMQSAASRMQILIKDVLAYSRISTRYEVVEPVDLNQVVSDVLMDMEQAIVEKKATVSVGTLPIIRGDAAQLRQLFQNLISNALKFTKPDEAASPPTVIIAARQTMGRELPGGMVPAPAADQRFSLIEIADNGIGFDPHDTGRIFQVFQRLHSRSSYQGTGIGLAIVQKVVENHHGHIVADGRPGLGATFWVAFPVV